MTSRDALMGGHVPSDWGTFSWNSVLSSPCIGTCDEGTPLVIVD